MPVLTKEQRNQLERVVLAAREIAEIGAVKALHTLGVGDPDPPTHLSPEQRLLRRALRAQARQLGDSEDGFKRGYYALNHLTEKLGYDQWHRMLFARFLAENSLLMSPQHGVSVSLEDCQELAPELGLRNGWEVAARFASEMLPQIFRTDDPKGKLRLAPEDLNALERQLTDLPQDTFLADDSLGWVYQFWQSKRKDEVNNSGKKIGANEIAPVTQLFTEDYMVQFLLHNTLGAWWAGINMPKEGIVAENEEEARKAISLPGIEWEYLRFIQDEQTRRWRPAAGIFSGWPHRAKDLKILDPCMGSGHFLVAELPILVAIRIKEENLSMAEAVKSVLNDNLFGLEIDTRCTQIAAFNLALAAWKIGRYQLLPRLNLACSGLGIYSSRESWLKLANDDASLRWGMDRLYDLFKDAPILGSLINPEKLPGSGFNISFNQLQPLLKIALTREETQKDDETYENGVTAEGVVNAAEILSGKFNLISTNVPYLGRGKQDETLQDYCEHVYPKSKADLATCFIERCLNLSSICGSVALVTPQNWLFLKDYKDIRKKLLTDVAWVFALRLGSGAFETISGEVVKASLIALRNRTPERDNSFFSLDVSGFSLIAEKARCIRDNQMTFLFQNDQLENPNYVVTSEPLTRGALLQNFATAYEGAKTVDIERFRHFFWELAIIRKSEWWFHNSSPTGHSLISGCHYISSNRSVGSLFEKNIRSYEQSGHKVVAWLCGQPCWGKIGISVAWMNDLPASLYIGTVFDNSAAVILPKSNDFLLPIYCFISSGEYTIEIRKINQKVQVAAGTLDQVPFDLSHWQKVAAEKYPNGLPEPYSDDPTQWIFNGFPKNSECPLHVAVARLLGYRWPRQTGSSFLDCPAISPDGLENYVDNDGIVCLHTTQNEASASDRLRALLADTYGIEWSNSKQADLLQQVGYVGKTLEEWLRNGFFEQHCQIFQQRPFIWQIWDGMKNGFSVLVNYHKLDKANLEKLTYSHLGNWIIKQKSAVEAGEEGSDALLTAAQELQRKLQLILEGDQPYDVFIRWKPLEKQPIGWEPDLNDGVRLNIRPFITAGILRKNPKINWNKDRGTDIAIAPWFSKFKGERINALHLTLDEKKKARNK